MPSDLDSASNLIMLELCEILKINVNELLSGEKIMAEVYDKRAEEKYQEKYIN